MQDQDAGQSIAQKSSIAVTDAPHQTYAEDVTQAILEIFARPMWESFKLQSRL
jgi:hypothetical protein